MTSKHIPSVSIGMPVYNGDKTINEVLNCIVKQTFCDFELIISDNSSTDKTKIICQKYASEDSRIRYVRQSENIGGAKNFAYVLDEARAKYFMWAASDDVRSVDFLEKNYCFLETNLDYVASTCRTRFEDGQFNSVQMGDASLIGNAPNRMQKYLNYWHANGRFYSLMRTDILKRNPYLKQDFLGSDWAVMLDVILHGKTKCHDQGYVVLGRNGFSNSGNILKTYRRKWIHWFIPMLELIKAILSMSAGFSTREKIKIIAPLFKLNLQAIRVSVRGELKRWLIP